MMMTDPEMAVRSSRAAVLARGLDTCLTLATDPGLLPSARDRGLEDALALMPQLAIEIAEMVQRRAMLQATAEG